MQRLLAFTRAGSQPDRAAAERSVASVRRAHSFSGGGVTSNFRLPQTSTRRWRRCLQRSASAAVCAATRSATPSAGRISWQAQIAALRARRQAGIDQRQRASCAFAAAIRLGHSSVSISRPIRGRKCSRKRPQAPAGRRAGRPAIRRSGLVISSRAVGAAGRRHVREQHVCSGRREQRLDQRFGGARFADRDGVQPEQRHPRSAWVEAVALADVLQVLRLLACAPEQPHPDQRHCQIEEQRIEQRIIAQPCSAAASTAAGSGVCARAAEIAEEPVAKDPGQCRIGRAT
jgi:Arc/MetJ family transcription regulator